MPPSSMPPSPRRIGRGNKIHRCIKLAKGTNGFCHEDTHSGGQRLCLIQSAATTAAHVSDVVVAAELLHGEEERMVYGDVGYQGLEKREEVADERWTVHRHKAWEAPPLPEDAEGTVHSGWSGPRLMSEPKWNTHSLCSSNSLDSRKPGSGVCRKPRQDDRASHPDQLKEPLNKLPWGPDELLGSPVEAGKAGA